MSKYTTTVRDICNEIILRKESIVVPSSGMTVDEILETTWGDIFEPFAFWKPEARGAFCQDILRHFYTREIGFETVGLWKLKINTKIREILPYYNKMFETMAMEYEPFRDVDYTRTLEGKEHGENNKSENTSKTDEGLSTETYDSNKKDKGKNHGVSKFSDTPQGGIVGIENDNYLTNATVDDNEGESSSAVDGRRTGRSKNDETVSLLGTGAFATTNNLVEHVVGKRSGVSYSKAMMEYRDSLINVELMIFEELNDLFMLLW